MTPVRVAMVATGRWSERRPHCAVAAALSIVLPSLDVARCLQ